MLATGIPVRLFRRHHVEPAHLDPRLLEAAHHLRQSPLDLPERLAAADLQRAAQNFALLLKSDQDRSEFGRIEADEDLPVAPGRGSLHGIQDLLADTLDRGPSRGGITADLGLNLHRNSGTLRRGG